MTAEELGERLANALEDVTVAQPWRGCRSGWTERRFGRPNSKSRLPQQAGHPPWSEVGRVAADERLKRRAMQVLQAVRAESELADHPHRRARVPSRRRCGRRLSDDGDLAVGEGM